jgi:hypothetical protein
MTKWTPDPDQIIHNFLSLGILFIISSIFCFFSFGRLMQNSSEILIVGNAIGSLLLLIYILGRIYSDINKKQDYIELTREGISFRETPAIGNGWLPQSNKLNFDELKSVDVVELSPLWNPNKKSTALLLWPKNQKQMIIGSQLTKSQQIKIGIALQGSVVLSKSLEKLMGMENIGPTIKDVFEGAKTIWDNYQKGKKG